MSFLPMTFCPHKSYGQSQSLCRRIYQGLQTYCTCHLAFESTVAEKVVQGLMELDDQRTVLGSIHGHLVVHPVSCSTGTKPSELLGGHVAYTFCCANMLWGSSQSNQLWWRSEEHHNICLPCLNGVLLWRLQSQKEKKFKPDWRLP